MRRLIVATLTPICVMMSGAAIAGSSSCEMKIAELERKIEYVKLHNNRYQLAGLQRALREVKTNCTNTGQLQRAEKNVLKRQESVQEAQQEVSEVQEELASAQIKDDAGKVAKYQQKLAEKQQKLRERIAELHQAEAELSALRE